MEIRYYPETDSLYIELLKGATSVKSYEVCDGLVVDIDSSGVAVGLEIEHLSHFTMNSGAEVGLDIQRRDSTDDAAVAAFGVDLEIVRNFVEGLSIPGTADHLTRRPA